jgi:hypothetical protein
MEGLTMELVADKSFELLCADNDFDVSIARRLLDELCNKKALPIEELELIIPKLAKIAKDVGDKLAAHNENQLRLPFDS